MSSLAAAIPQLARLRTRIFRGSTRRLIAGPIHPAIFGMLLCIAFFALFRLDPLQAWWRLVYQGLAVYVWWPVPVYLCIASFLVAGWLRHRQTGSPLYSPVAALIAASVLFAIAVDLIIEWAASHSMLRWPLLGAIGLMAAFSLVAGCICYRQTWRRHFNRAVVNRVRQSLRDGSFARYLRGSYFPGLSVPVWGSPHCLIIVLGHYQEAKALLRNRLMERNVQRHLDHCIHAGEVLATYLGLRWTADTPLSGEWQVRRGDLYRELITLSLWAHSLNNYARVDPARIDAWLREMTQDLASRSPAYASFLRVVFHLPRAGNRQTPTELAVIEQLLSLYREIPQEPLTMQGRSYDARRIARDTFVAVASPAMPAQAVLDVWLALHDVNADPLDLGAEQESEPSDSWARQQVSVLYRNWASRIPVDWRSLLMARATRADETRASLAISESNTDDPMLSQ